jgi:hypothetical protein
MKHIPSPMLFFTVTPIRSLHKQKKKQAAPKLSTLKTVQHWRPFKSKEACIFASKYLCRFTLACIYFVITLFHTRDLIRMWLSYFRRVLLRTPTHVLLCFSVKHYMNKNQERKRVCINAHAYSKSVNECDVTVRGRERERCTIHWRAWTGFASGVFLMIVSWNMVSMKHFLQNKDRD